MTASRPAAVYACYECECGFTKAMEIPAGEAIETIDCMKCWKHGYVREMAVVRVGYGKNDDEA